MENHLGGVTDMVCGGGGVEEEKEEEGEGG